MTTVRMELFCPCCKNRLSATIERHGWFLGATYLLTLYCARKKNPR